MRTCCMVLLVALLMWSAPASATHDTDDMTERETSNDLGSMHYFVYAPPSAAGPMLHLHGGNNAAPDAAHRSRLNTLAREKGFIAVNPQDDSNEGRYGGSGIWDAGPAADEGRGSRPTSLVAQITHEVSAAYRVDTDRIFIGGISAGAAMALVTAAQYPELYAGVQMEAEAKYGTGDDFAISTDPPSVEYRHLRTVEDTGRRVYEAMGDNARRIPIVVSWGTSDPFAMRHDQKGVAEHWLVAHDWMDDDERTTACP